MATTAKKSTTKTTAAAKKASATAKKTTAVKSIKLNKTLAVLELKKNKTLQLKVTFNPKNPTNKKIIWTSSNKKAATVSASGKVTAKAPGKTVITARSISGGKTAKCTVTVNREAMIPTDFKEEFDY